MFGCDEVGMEKLSYGMEEVFQGKVKVPTMALEAVVDSRLWFWHAYFSMPSTNNDLNVLDHCPLFRNLLTGTAPEVEFTVNGVMLVTI